MRYLTDSFVQGFQPEGAQGAVKLNSCPKRQAAAKEVTLHLTGFEYGGSRSYNSAPDTIPTGRSGE